VYCRRRVSKRMSCMMNMGRRTARTYRGSVLIELIAALFVLTVGMFGVIQMYQFGLAKMHTMNEAAVAMGAVQNEVETLRATPFDELRNVEAGPFRSKTSATAKLVNAVPTVSIRDYEDGAPRLKEVRVSIKWTGEHGRSITKSVTTLIADKGSQ